MLRKERSRVWVVKLFSEAEVTGPVQQRRDREITTLSLRNIVLNTVLSGLKIAAGLLAGSLAVLSDGLNSLSDAAMTVVVLVGRRVTGAPADREHPYGHEKIESLITMFIAVFLCAGAAYTVYESVLRLLTRQAVGLSWFALGATLLSAAVKFYMHRSTRAVARRLDSDMLKLVAMDYGFDVVLSCCVFAGVLLAMLGLWFFEPLAAIAASGILLKAAAGFFRKAFNQLVDRAADAQTVEKIQEMVLSCPGVRNLDLLLTRRHGNALYVDIEISVDPYITVSEGHGIAQQVHDRLEGEPGWRVKHCMVHVNPADMDLP